MPHLRLSLILILLCSTPAWAEDGLISMQSKHNVTHTVERLKIALEAKGMTIFTIINHAQGAQHVGKTLRPTQLVIFGNPKLGTVLMQCHQSIAIDLPQKALIWQDEKGHVWLSYNNPEYLLKRHHIQGCKKVASKIAHALHHFAVAATAQYAVLHHTTDAH